MQQCVLRLAIAGAKQTARLKPIAVAAANSHDQDAALELDESVCHAKVQPGNSRRQPALNARLKKTNEPHQVQASAALGEAA